MAAPLVTRFAQAGLPLEHVDRPLFRGGEDIVQFDIRRTARDEERFRLWTGHPDNRVLVTTIDRARQQLIVLVHEARRRFEVEVSRHAPRPEGRLVRETKHARVFERFTDERKRHFLCGMDEQHLFIAQLPRAAPTVWAAHVALKGDDVRQAERRMPGRTLRQGEWFFVHPTPRELEAVDEAVRRAPHLVVRGQGIAQAARLPRVGRPHVADEVLVLKGNIYVRGHVRHPDHATLSLRGWRRTFGNTEASQPEGVAWVD